GIDVKVEDVIKGIKIDDLKIDPKDVKVEVILDQLKAVPEIRDVIIKKLDGQVLELKGKKLEDAAKARMLLDNAKLQKDGKVIVDLKKTKSDDIEARLERLMKELQELQKEVKAGKKKKVD